jgi:glucosamine-6-phosphate deaminase
VAEIVIVDSADAAGELAADAVHRLVADRPDAVLGFATGSTPLPLYRALERRVSSGALDLSSIRGFALDEYVGLPEGHAQGYGEVLRREVLEPLRLDAGSMRVPDGRSRGIETAGERYEQLIEDAGGVDLQVLGIGTDGHIGFNEPGSSFASVTRVKTLTEQTRLDNARFFGSPDEVPRHCITQGLGTILRARHLILLAFGEGKADAIAAAVEGPVSANVPGSAIQLHARATVIVDEAAASRLARADYYRYAWANKPTWQVI